MNAENDLKAQADQNIPEGYDPICIASAIHSRTSWRKR